MGKPGSSVFRALHKELASSMLPILESSGSNLEGSPAGLLLEANGSDGSSAKDGSAGEDASIPGKHGSPGNCKLVDVFCLSVCSTSMYLA
jgi:hypothetical protein